MTTVTAMKKLLNSLLVVTLASSCTTDPTTDETPITSSKQMMEITVSIETDDHMQDESRTSLFDNNSGGKIEWSSNDIIGAVSEDGTLTKCPITSIGENGKATLSVPTDIKYAFYPYIADTKLVDEGLQVSLPQTAIFDGKNRVFGDGQNFMTALFADNSLSFKNLCGYIEVKLKGTQTVTGIALRDNVIDWNALSGIATVNIDGSDQTPSLTMGTYHGSTFNWIYGRCENDVRLNTDTPTSFYFIVPPGSYNHLNLCILTTEGSYSFTGSSPIVVNRSKIRPLSAIDLSSFVASEATRLDIDGTANCYVVPQGDRTASYSFAAKKINGSTAIENIAYAQLVWSTDADMIDKLHYDAAKGTVEFEYAGGGKEGNAVVAVADAENTILWCWHIWCTDKPECITVKGGDNTTFYAILDRNLGATYTPKSIADVNNISDEEATAACGLYYQYGRPTPFPGPKSIRTATETAFKTNTDVAIQYGFKAYGQDFRMASNANEFDRALQYPNLFFTCYVNSAGEIQSGSAGAAGNRWQKELLNPFTDMKKAWFSQNNANITFKSDYDPCPAGYVVDDSSSGYHYMGKSSFTRHGWSPAANTIYGYYLYQELTETMLYCPVAGFRDASGKAYGLGQYLNYWFVPTSDQGNIKTYRFSAGNSTSSSMTINCAAYANQSFGFNLRCRRMNRDQSIVIEDVFTISRR